MLYDLNIPCSPSTNRDSLKQTLQTALSLGYDVLVLNHQISPPVPSAMTNPLPPSSTLFPPQPATSAAPKPKTPRILHRATITMHDHAAQHRLPLATSHYDLVAVRPTTDACFTQVCLNTPPDHCALISLDLASQLPFHFRPKPCMAALSRGLRFEVCYAQALGGDQRARALFAANLRGLVRATKGRGIVISSEARGPLQLRGPADVVNLMNVWGGLGSEKGTEGIGAIPRGVLVNEGLKRSGYRGAVGVVEVAEGGEGKKEGGEGKEKEGGNKGKRKEAGGTEEGNRRSSKKAKKAAARAAREGAGGAAGGG